MRGAPLSLKGRALRLLSQREHSRAELQRKLAAHEEAPGELARVLDELEAKGFIDEQRVVDSLVHRRAGRLGAARVRQELHAKGVSADAVAQALDALQGSEVERASEVWRKKFACPPADPREWARQVRFLMARGFDSAAVRQVLDQARAHASAPDAEH